MLDLNDISDQRVTERPACDGAIFARAPVPLFVLDANAVVAEVSDRCLDLLAYCRKEVLGRHASDFDDSSSPRLTMAAWKAFLARGEIRDLERTLVRRDGTKLHVLISATVEHSSSSGEVWVIAALVDLTGRNSADAALKASEAGLRRAEKMDAVGQLTGGIAHDFNNVLQTMKSNLELIRCRSLNGRPDISRLADNALDAADKASKLSSQLLAFARSEPLDLRPLDPVTVIGGIRELLARASGDRITLRVDYSEKAVPVCLGDQNQLECALLNLVINARDAISGAVGNIAISLRVERVEDAPGVGPASGVYVRIAVCDDGPGMSEEIRRRAFEPFFTTKGAGKGSGLGLAQIHRFVQQCGGAVLIESAPGKGTEVAMLLPSTDLPLPRPLEPAVSSVEAKAGVGETVLIVEDDEMVRATLAVTLCDLQYEVVEAVDADAALAFLESGKAVDLIFTDLSMPGSMDGLEFAWSTRRRFSRLPVILATGQVGALGGKALPAGAAFMQKPYSRAELAAALRNALVKT